MLKLRTISIHEDDCFFISLLPYELAIKSRLGVLNGFV